MSQMTYQVILSTDGKHTVIITGDDQAEMKAAATWAKGTYEAIVNQYGLKGAPKQSTAQQGEGSEPTPICQTHQVPMVRVEGKRGPFWSCHERNADGSFCNYRPNL